MCMGVASACMSIHHGHAVHVEAKRGPLIPGPRVTDGYDLRVLGIESVSSRRGTS